MCSRLPAHYVKPSSEISHVSGVPVLCSYRPFLPILGTGLVTADGDLWQKQRTLMGPALRIEVLDDIIVIAKNSVDRLCAKLERYRGTGEPVEINEEIRLLKLQAIGEAVLSMAPEECDKVWGDVSHLMVIRWCPVFQLPRSAADFKCSLECSIKMKDV